MVAIFHVTSERLSSVAAGGVNLDFDASLFVQVGFMILLWVVLKPVLFDPMIKLFEEREKRIEGNIKKARRIDGESAEAKAKYDDAMAIARAEGASEREKLRTEGLRKESELLSKVRGETQARMDVARKKAEQEVAAVRTQLGTQAQTLAKDLATRVLGREVSR
jgi:F-type H+-transporting ATPase subunit b